MKDPAEETLCCPNQNQINVSGAGDFVKFPARISFGIRELQKSRIASGVHTPADNLQMPSRTGLVGSIYSPHDRMTGA